MPPPIQVPVADAEMATFCQRNAIRKLALFGSILRADFDDHSDIDVLVEFEPDAKPGLFDLAHMGRELGQLFGRPVDLLTSGFLSPHFRQQVVESARVIYEKDTVDC